MAFKYDHGAGRSIPAGPTVGHAEFRMAGGTSVLPVLRFPLRGAYNRGKYGRAAWVEFATRVTDWHSVVGGRGWGG